MAYELNLSENVWSADVVPVDRSVLYFPGLAWVACRVGRYPQLNTNLQHQFLYVQVCTKKYDAQVSSRSLYVSTRPLFLTLLLAHTVSTTAITIITVAAITTTAVLLLVLHHHLYHWYHH